MTNKIEDGGPAFPHDMSSEPGGFGYSHDGMTLRDYFAAKAMQGILANQDERRSGEGRGTGLGSNVDVAQWAYKLADAMIERRGR